MDDTLLDPTLNFSSSLFTTFVDARILRALADHGFTTPTLVQSKAIPLIVGGKDVLARARTGSGKTGAYVVPAIQKVLSGRKDVSDNAKPVSSTCTLTRFIISQATSSTKQISVLILVPTRELAHQVTTFAKSLTKYCEGVDAVKIVNAATGNALSAAGGAVLHDVPDILVITPSRCLSMLQSKVSHNTKFPQAKIHRLMLSSLVQTISLHSLSLLIIDEADLILSYGHSDDLQRLLDPSQNWIPRVGVQGVLMSATLGGTEAGNGANADVEKLKGLALRNPVSGIVDYMGLKVMADATDTQTPQAILTLQESASTNSLLKHYSLTASETDKFLLIYVLLKLKLIRGKILLFVNTIDRGYRLKLFLEQFGLNGCLLNSEMPLNSRWVADSVRFLSLSTDRLMGLADITLSKSLIAGNTITSSRQTNLIHPPQTTNRRLSKHQRRHLRAS